MTAIIIRTRNIKIPLGGVGAVHGGWQTIRTARNARQTTQADRRETETTIALSMHNLFSGASMPQWKWKDYIRGTSSIYILLNILPCRADGKAVWNIDIDGDNVAEHIDTIYFLSQTQAYVSCPKNEK